MHMRRAIHAILVLAKIVPFAPMRVRKHRVGFDNQLELFLVSALGTQKGYTHPYISMLQSEVEGCHTLSG